VDLNLDPEISITTLRGEDPRDLTYPLSNILDTVRARLSVLAGEGKRRWEGEPTVVVIAPSSEVLSHYAFANIAIVETLARLCRPAGVSLRLIDATPSQRPGFPPLSAFGGSSLLRSFASDDALASVSYHYVTPADLVSMTEIDHGGAIRVQATVGDPAEQDVTELEALELPATGDLDVLRSEIINAVMFHPGSTEAEIVGIVVGPGFTTDQIADLRAVLRELIARGTVIVGAGGRHYDRNDAAGLHITKEEER
jgi:hypothetical protein